MPAEIQYISEMCVNLVKKQSRNTLKIVLKMSELCRKVVELVYYYRLKSAPCENTVIGLLSESCMKSVRFMC